MNTPPPKKQKKTGEGAVEPLWEASLLRSHVHPSVSRFAESLLSARQRHVVEYKGDPLADFALMPFLNRMAYKNPKARDKDKTQGRGVSTRSCVWYRRSTVGGSLCVRASISR